MRCVHRVPPIFFLEATVSASHPSRDTKFLRPLGRIPRTSGGRWGSIEENPNFGSEGNEDEADRNDFDDDERDNGAQIVARSRRCQSNTNLILDMAAGLKHQPQFRDQRLAREGAGFLRHAWRRKGGETQPGVTCVDVNIPKLSSLLPRSNSGPHRLQGDQIIHAAYCDS